MLEAKDLARIGRSLTLIKFYPRQDHDAILEFLASFVDDAEKLRWLVNVAVNTWRDWPGPAELRALYATRYKPADGLPVSDSQTVGFTPEDSEAAYMAAEADETARRIAQWKREAAQLPAAEQEANRQLALELVWPPRRRQ